MEYYYLSCYNSNPPMPAPRKVPSPWLNTTTCTHHYMLHTPPPAQHHHLHTPHYQFFRQKAALAAIGIFFCVLFDNAFRRAKMIERKVLLWATSALVPLRTERRSKALPPMAKKTPPSASSPRHSQTLSASTKAENTTLLTADVLR